MAAPYKLGLQLLQAIDDADKTTLQRVLKSMCEDSAECKKAAEQRLFLIPVHVVVEIEDDTSDRDAGPARKKQRRETPISDNPVSRYETCATCRNRFDILDNQEDSCQQHDGDLEVDLDYFPDDDDIQAGVDIDVNSDWRVEEFPDGFVWSCCEETTNGPPCVVQKHIAMKR